MTKRNNNIQYTSESKVANMIEYIKLDVLSVTDNGILAHGVNCVGVMGAGIAKSVKECYPAVFDSYVREVYKSETSDIIGKTSLILAGNNLFVANMYTQKTFHDAKVEYIASALYDLDEKMKYHSIDLPIYMPRIGCGLGGLTWEPVGAAIEEFCKTTGRKVFVCDL